MTGKDNRSNMEQLDPVNLCGQMAAFLLERECLALKEKTFLVQGSTAIANRLFYFALEHGDAYHELLRCGTTDELKLLHMDQDILAAAPAQEVLKVVRDIQVLLFALQHEVTYITTGKPNVFAIGHDGLLSREGMDFDFDLGFDLDLPVPDDKGTQGDSSS